MMDPLVRSYAMRFSISAFLTLHILIEVICCLLINLARVTSSYQSEKIGEKDWVKFIFQFRIQAAMNGFLLGVIFLSTLGKIIWSSFKMIKYRLIFQRFMAFIWIIPWRGSLLSTGWWNIYSLVLSTIRELGQSSILQILFTLPYA